MQFLLCPENKHLHQSSCFMARKITLLLKITLNVIFPKTLVNAAMKMKRFYSFIFCIQRDTHLKNKIIFRV